MRVGIAALECLTDGGVKVGPSHEFYLWHGLHLRHNLRRADADADYAHA
jgi:hypothetical protein